MVNDISIIPKNEVVTVLRARLTDYNSAGRTPSGSNWIYPDRPRLDLAKTSFPRISVTDITETGVIMDVAAQMQFEARLQIDVWVWAGINGQDSQLLTISSTVYEGQKLLDLIAQDVVYALNDNKSDFYNDTNLLYNFREDGKVDMGADDQQPMLIRKRIDVAFTYHR